jgi:hypothetical protein
MLFCDSETPRDERENRCGRCSPVDAEPLCGWSIRFSSTHAKPRVCVIAILTLALGIGATTGIFSVLNAWIIQPLPLKDPQQLVIFWRAAAASPNEPAYYFSWRDYVYFRERSERGYALTGSGVPESLHGGILSRSLFSTLGVTAFRGRLSSRTMKRGRRLR